MIKQILHVSLILICAVLFLPGTLRAEIPIVKVKVAQTKGELFIMLEKYMQVSCYRNGQLVCNYHAYAGLTLKINSGKIVLQDAKGVLEQGLDSLSFSPKRPSRYISVNGKKYRGSLLVVISNGSEDLVGINHVKLEGYLKGVVPLEMGIKLVVDHRDQEALKVQAVAARTYALSKLGQYPGRPYDLESTVADQLYGGIDVEEALIDKAIKQTRGEVLTNNHTLVKAYFHANCGGHTESIERAWPWKPAENYLWARPDSDFCSWAKNYSWTQTWSKSQIEKSISQFVGTTLKDSAFQCGNLLELQVKERSVSGRIMLLRIIADQGEWEVKSDSIRWCFRRGGLNGSILPSTKFDIKITRNQAGEIFSVEFTGTGNGHGVGMCQIGALGRARTGQSYREIAAFYYPGTTLTRRY